MIEGLRILAVVPARAGSKGVIDKNIQKVGGRSLIAIAGEVLNDSECDFIDRKIISTDSVSYREEAEESGLECPFIRPDSLSHDRAGAIETMIHAWEASEGYYKESYDVLLIIEPTCPLRLPQDIRQTADALIKHKAESAVSVSIVDSKYHPNKILQLNDDKLDFYNAEGASIQSRQQLGDLYFRNGACYAITRECLLVNKRIFGDYTVPCLIERPLANIDCQLDLDFANFMKEQQ